METWVTAEEWTKDPKSWCLVDVRTPSEYERGHIPGAYNVPLFSDEERARVGLCYKIEGRTSAILLGLELVGPKMRDLAEQMNALATAHLPMLLYCWRGGMRSESMAWLLSRFGGQVFRLQGGYKAFRQTVLTEMELPRKFLLLGGKTGSGKTKLLRMLQACGEPVIDLEALAHHKGSSFGMLGESAQPSQQQFENELGTRLATHALSEVIWLENESRCIGQVTIPVSLWEQMSCGPVVDLQVPKEQRIRYLVEVYGGYEKTHLRESIVRIQSRLGPQHAQEALLALEEGKLESCCDILLQHYYDKMYGRGRDRKRELLWIAVDHQERQDDDVVRELLEIRANVASEHPKFGLT